MRQFMIKKISKKLISLFLFFTIVLITFGCTKNNNTNIDMSLTGGMLTNAGMDYNIYNSDDTKEIKDRILYDSLNILVLALKAKKINVALLDDSVASYLTINDKTLESLKDVENTTANYAMCFRNNDEGKLMCKEINEIIKNLKSSRVLDVISNRYITDVIKGNSIEPDNLIHFSDSSKIIRVGITGDLPPMDFIDNNGNPAGFNIALLNAISEKLHINFEPVIVESAARATSLMSGKIDCIFWTQTICKNNNILSSDDIPDNTIITDYYYVAPLSKVFYKSDKNIILK